MRDPRFESIDGDTLVTVTGGCCKGKFKMRAQMVVAPPAPPAPTPPPPQPQGDDVDVVVATGAQGGSAIQQAMAGGAGFQQPQIG